MVGLIGLLPFSFSLHFSSKIPAICFGNAKAGVKSDILTVLFVPVLMEQAVS